MGITGAPFGRTELLIPPPRNRQAEILLGGRGPGGPGGGGGENVPGSVQFGFTPVLFGPRFHQNRGPISAGVFFYQGRVAKAKT